MLLKAVFVCGSSSGHFGVGDLVVPAAVPGLPLISWETLDAGHATQGLCTWSLSVDAKTISTEFWEVSKK